MEFEAGGAAEGTPRNLIVLSDGTGNSTNAFWKTNVWRLYQALDLTEFSIGPGGESLPRQIACYDSGVGSSSFRPLALLGGVFGWGLNRNVLDLYTFLCRNHRPGDRIYAFGFSRGKRCPGTCPGTISPPPRYWPWGVLPSAAEKS